MSSEKAHISVPIEVTPIANQLQDVFNFSNELSELAYKLGTDTQGGLYCKALSYTVDQKYRLLNAKFETIIFYLTRREEYDSSSVSSMIQKRSIPLDHILPDHAVKNPSFSRNTLQLLSQGFQPTGVHYRKSLETPDDEGTKPIITSAPPEGEGAKPIITSAPPDDEGVKTNITSGPPTTTSTTTTITTVKTTTGTTNITETTTPVSWKEFYEIGVNRSKIATEPILKKGPRPLEFPTPYTHFTNDDFFENTQYPQLYKHKWSDLWNSSFFNGPAKRSVPSYRSEDHSKPHIIKDSVLSRLPC